MCIYMYSYRVDKDEGNNSNLPANKKEVYFCQEQDDSFKVNPLNVDDSWPEKAISISQMLLSSCIRYIVIGGPESVLNSASKKGHLP